MDVTRTAAEDSGRTSCGAAGGAELPASPPPASRPSAPPQPVSLPQGGRGAAGAGPPAGWAAWRCWLIAGGQGASGPRGWLRRGAGARDAEQPCPARAETSRRVAEAEAAPSPAGAGPSTELRPSGASGRALGEPAEAGSRRKRRLRVPSGARHVGRAPQGPAVHGAPLSA